jgi:flagellar basal-body rod modification protein FlgD
MAVGNVTTNAATTPATSAVTGASDATSADRFLKLLVAQMQNQDPLNPLDNAQVTSQMAQINTVSGIEKLNTTVQGLQSSFMQMQALQGASLVGHDVIVAGNKLDFSNGTGGTGATGVGGFELTSPADAVKLEVLNSAVASSTPCSWARAPAAATASSGTRPSSAPTPTSPSRSPPPQAPPRFLRPR